MVPFSMFFEWTSNFGVDGDLPLKNGQRLKGLDESTSRKGVPTSCDLNRCYELGRGQRPSLEEWTKTKRLDESTSRKRLPTSRNLNRWYEFGRGRRPSLED